MKNEALIEPKEDADTKTYYCRNCNNPIEAEKGAKEGFCECCQSEVYLLTASQ